MTSNVNISDHKLAMTDTSSRSDVDTLDSDSYGRQLEEIRINNPQGDTSTQTGVDVNAAEKDFEELNRQFSSISHQAQKLSRQASRASKPGTVTHDIEKDGGSTASDDSWDLESTLRGDYTASEQAGIKNKHIGM
jgi:ATP-binding cassette subfamily G (WHITE) protein 2 (SNQ2)